MDRMTYRLSLIPAVVNVLIRCPDDLLCRKGLAGVAFEMLVAGLQNIFHMLVCLFLRGDQEEKFIAHYLDTNQISFHSITPSIISPSAGSI
jgi:hypothetical protein